MHAFAKEWWISLVAILVAMNAISNGQIDLSMTTLMVGVEEAGYILTLLALLPNLALQTADHVERPPCESVVRRLGGHGFRQIHLPNPDGNRRSNGQVFHHALDRLR